MKLISVRCNECGAPLEVADTSRFVTCKFCQVQLAIERTDSAVFTEKVDAIHQNTEQIVDNLVVIRLQNDLELLDREWMIERERYMVRDKHGNTSEPGVFSFIAGIAAVGFGIFWTVMVSQSGAPGFFSLFGVLFVIVGIFGVLSNLTKSSSLATAQTRYQGQRSELLRRLNEAKRG